MLGAAVADDVLGLVILTVVTRVVTEGSVSALGIVKVTVVAIGFVVVATMVGLRFAPPLFAWIRRYSRSAGTLVVLAFAFTLAFAEFANLADLAPIIGAFVAGLALGPYQLRPTASAATWRRSDTCSCRSSSCRSVSTPTSRPWPTGRCSASPRCSS